ncbi:hypothetical protein IC006_2231 [Sulfuracidifex tepidarius]|uniref:Uncharacterized protein n=1 Tax=Sulfuracidifex tepidarius TaxID=1294262 RepID=A0A510DXG6_9CREN|nr:LamG-like jellyroll fold domain-containing protein [Sulfuracidifex tepidarius]BBG24897.1 hypothetical protein IC006_2231 [Sulfuracidifex tepidarius]
MSKISRRQFVGLLAVGSIGITAVVLEGSRKGNNYNSGSPTSSKTSLAGTTFTPLVILVGSSQQCKAIGSNGEVIFSGTCSDGSGTCGIYEAMQYVNQNFGAGKVDLIGEFYPTSSPSPIPNVELDGNAVIYLSPANLQFIMSSTRGNGIKLLWYQNYGFVNTLLSRSPSFSLSPYFFFPTTASSVFFANGDLTLGTPSSFTVGAWVNGNQNNNGGYILTYGSMSGISWAIQYGYGAILFNTDQTLKYYYDEAPFHVAVTYDNGDVTLYVNGKPVSTSTSSISYVTPSYLWLNNFPKVNQQSGLSPSSPFSSIENVQFYPKVLSQSQIEAIASPTASPVDPSISFWALYRYIFYLGDLITGKGFQRMGGVLEGGVF